MPLPLLSLNNGPNEFIGLPLSETQAKAIINAATQAPFGRGEDTVVDTSVRRTWQLDPTDFSIGNAQWTEQLQELLIKVKADLGCDASKQVCCELYKLLLYEPGGMFKVRELQVLLHEVTCLLFLCSATETLRSVQGCLASW